MSTHTPSGSKVSATTPDVGGSARRPRLPRRRRPALIALGVALVLAAVTANTVLIASLDNRVPVLVLVRDVTWGAPVTPADVRSVPLPPEDLGYAIPATETNQVLGQTALDSLPAGSVLSRRELTVQPVPWAGQRLIGLHLAPGRYPTARGLHPGDPIQVLPMTGGGPTSGQSSVDTTAAAPQARPGFTARVVQVSPPDSNGAITADVLVPAATAEQAGTAAAGDVVVILLGPS
jgi:hypothetical protein